MKTVLIIAGCIVMLIPIAIYMLGAKLPTKHVAEGTRKIDAESNIVAGWVRNIQNQTDWRKGLEKIEIIESSPVIRYREKTSHGEITFLFREVEAGKRFESVIDDPKLPFSGRWLISLQPKGAATLITVREEGEVHSPIFRFFAHYVFGHEKTLNGYLDDLAAWPPRAAAFSKRKNPSR
jgi:hypothetical protein